MLYTSTALTDVKLFKVKLHDFQAKFPAEVHSLMEPKSLQKLEWIKSRLERVHFTRSKLADQDLQSASFEPTLNKVRQIYPLSTLGSQLALRKVLLSEASGNPNLLIFAQNKRLENVRERMNALRDDRAGK
jgi:hypothetical protein